MARADPIREALQRLNEARRDPRATASMAELRAGLKSKFNHVVARAAMIAGEANLHDLVPAMEDAYGRLIADPLKTDKACLGKIAIVGAIAKLGSGGEAVLLKAARCFQVEPAYSETIDTAVEVRAMAAIALAERHHPGALDVATELLADRELNARIGALKALETLPSDGARALLKYKLLIRDREPEVIAENLKALLSVEPSEMPLASELMLDPDERLAAMAALAVGESRAAGAYEALRETYDRRLGFEFRANVLLALALLRDERCLDLICEVASGSDPEMAARALEAALPFASDADFRGRLKAAVLLTKDKARLAAFEERFGEAEPGLRRGRA